jgi:2'-5' RNA ligase
MIRLFVGLALPGPVRERLSGLAAGIPAARWIAADNLHVTLRFIGEVDEPMADHVHDALAGLSVPAFAATIAGCGTFDRGQRVHTLWAGVERTPPLVHLRDKIESALVRIGLESERRRFQPHVTLARVKGAPVGKLQDFVAANNLLRITIAIDAFALFSSRLGTGEPVYVAEAEYPLEQTA